ncbi:hypothetical protein PB1_00260 [Bacillus methanolicus PB1]|uniref:Uncharacterized protein n=1 Tax=Bacillus methanolicus PB1 TaxID=997296 RepID=I3E4B0_BACMT|nr:hypothetical protein PB1_00260 [Bacillus methanolicus PB1]
MVLKIIHQVTNEVGDELLLMELNPCDLMAIGISLSLIDRSRAKNHFDPNKGFSTYLFVCYNKQINLEKTDLG